MDRLVKFHLIGEYKTDGLTAIRGWCQANQDRYEIALEDGQWTCLRVVLNRFDDGWGFESIPAKNDLFSCMVAAEKDAVERQHNSFLATHDYDGYLDHGE